MPPFRDAVGLIYGKPGDQTPVVKRSENGPDFLRSCQLGSDVEELGAWFLAVEVI